MIVNPLTVAKNHSISTLRNSNLSEMNGLRGAVSLRTRQTGQSVTTLADSQMLMTALTLHMDVVTLWLAFKTSKNVGLPMPQISTGMAAFSRKNLLQSAETKSILDTGGITQESTYATFPLLGNSLPMLRMLDRGKNVVKSLNQPWSQHSW